MCNQLPQADVLSWEQVAVPFSPLLAGLCLGVSEVGLTGQPPPAQQQCQVQCSVYVLGTSLCVCGMCICMLYGPM